MNDLYALVSGIIVTYPADLKLFKELGLQPFSIATREKTYIGQHWFPDYKKTSVKIWVTCMPAQFWTFEVTTESGAIYLVETGSGLLTEYWDSIEKIATNCLVVSEKK